MILRKTRAINEIREQIKTADPAAPRFALEVWSGDECVNRIPVDDSYSFTLSGEHSIKLVKI